MPLADPSSSLKCATRHLFRHLDDPKRLRRNPLVSRLFECSSRGHFDREAGAKALQEVRRLVTQAIQDIKTADAPSGDAKRSRFQCALVQKTYLESVPLSCIAVELGLSVRHLYRERAAACERIASLLRESRSAASTVGALFDVQEFQFERACLVAESGSAEVALTLYATILNATPSHRVKAEAELSSTEVALSAGLLSGAKAALCGLRTLSAWRRGIRGVRGRAFYGTHGTCVGASRFSIGSIRPRRDRSRRSDSNRHDDTRASRRSEILYRPRPRAFKSLVGRRCIRRSESRP